MSAGWERARVERDDGRPMAAAGRGVGGAAGDRRAPMALHRALDVDDHRPAGARIDFAAAGGIDPERLERSLALRGERLGDGRYRVLGGEQEHWVDLYTRAVPRCDCGDHLWRDAICKHILAALLREGDERVVRAVGALVGRLRRAA